jgi:hypothetical protein
MLKFFIFLLLIPFYSFSQNEASSSSADSTGKYFTGGFKPGNITLKNNSVKSGLIKFNGKLKFKSTKKDTVTSYDPWDVKSFYVHQDTFITARNLKFRYQRMWGDMDTDIEYIKQVIFGKVSLYEFQIKASNGSGTYYSVNYYIHKSPSAHYTLVPLNKKKFIEMMVPFFKEDISLITAIKDGTLKYDDLVAILKEYNAGKTKNPINISN